MKNNITILVLLVNLSVLCSCSTDTAPTQDPTEPEPGTPVTVTTVMIGTIADTIELNATSVFQLKTFIKANATGYLQTVNARLGKYVTRGEVVFVIKTKEAEALGNTINQLDSSFRFTGMVQIKAPGSGYISSLAYTKGNYVTDGEQLAEVSDVTSFAFVMDMPYELKSYLAANQRLRLKLPDGTLLNGHVASALPVVDSVSQTQKIVIRVDNKQLIPENLVAKATLVKSLKTNIITLSKGAVLTDDVQGQFWVMKLIDSVTAVKVPVQKGLENSRQVEIVSPAFKREDRFLLTGNEGLPDTARVTVIQQ